jgi:hypothetical protein
VERGGDDDLDVVDAVVGEELEDDREHALAHVGRAHRRERERDVVDGDDDLHPGRSFAWSGSSPVGVVQRVADRGVDVLQRLERRARVDGARAGGEIDVDERSPEKIVRGALLRSSVTTSGSVDPQGGAREARGGMQSL